MGGASSKNGTSTSKLDYAAVRADLKALMEDPDFDDGSYAPTLIRLGWHSSGTYDPTNSAAPGGCNGATMRYTLESSDPENNGLATARGLLEPIKAKYPGISYSDLWILAAYVALEVTNGPKLEFTPGRVDKPESAAVPPGRLPEAEHGLAPLITSAAIDKKSAEKVKKGEGVESEAESVVQNLDCNLDVEGRIKGWEGLAAHIRAVFGRMGFSDRETVALIAGGHMYGRCHPEHSGYAGAWVETPTNFNNEFARDLLEDEWMCVTNTTTVDGEPIPEETRPVPGKRQYMSKWSPLRNSAAPDILTKYPVGRYRISVGWVNLRRDYEPSSYVIGTPQRNEVFNIVCVRVYGAGVRGQLDTGGWISIVATDGNETMAERIGDIELPVIDATVPNVRFRALKNTINKAHMFVDVKAIEEGVSSGTFAQKGLDVVDFYTKNALKSNEGDNAAMISVFEMFGRLDSGVWIQLVSTTEGAMFERVVPGVNDVPRKSIKKLQVKYQMMLPSDMIMLWDEEFKKYLEIYAADEEVLKKEFGAAYKKLTELGCNFK